MPNETPSGADNHINDDEWLPDEAFTSVRDELKTVYPEETTAESLRRLIAESSVEAVVSIAHIAKFDANSRNRLAASEYLVDRVLGRIGEDLAGEKNPLQSFLQEVTTYANTETGHKVDESTDKTVEG